MESEKFPKIHRNDLKIVFLPLPSVKQLKKYEKGGFLSFLVFWSFLTTFYSVLIGLETGILKVPKNPLNELKIVFLRLPSVKHLKKYEKGGF